MGKLRQFVLIGDLHLMQKTSTSDARHVTSMKAMSCTITLLTQIQTKLTYFGMQDWCLICHLLKPCVI